MCNLLIFLCNWKVWPNPLVLSNSGSLGPVPKKKKARIISESFVNARALRASQNQIQRNTPVAYSNWKLKPSKQVWLGWVFFFRLKSMIYYSGGHINRKPGIIYLDSNQANPWDFQFSGFLITLPYYHRTKVTQSWCKWVERTSVRCGLVVKLYLQR